MSVLRGRQSLNKLSEEFPPIQPLNISPICIHKFTSEEMQYINIEEPPVTIGQMPELNVLVESQNVELLEPIIEQICVEPEVLVAPDENQTAEILELIVEQAYIAIQDVVEIEAPKQITKSKEIIPEKAHANIANLPVKSKPTVIIIIRR